MMDVFLRALAAKSISSFKVANGMQTTYTTFVSLFAFQLQDSRQKANEMAQIKSQ
jgi:hypothetical protein